MLPPHVENVILDFDDTLVTGPLTWALDVGLPTFIRDHDLPVTLEALDAAVLRAQEKASGGDDPIAVLNQFFVEMRWNPDLQMQLFDEVSERYQPLLYEDTLLFLTSVVKRVKHVVVISNNNRAPQVAERLGIAGYLPHMLTPKRIPGALPKPDRSMWEHLTALMPEISLENSLLIGDDPWSDGAFALACGLRFWLVDRKERYRHLSGAYPVIPSLAALITS